MAQGSTDVRVGAGHRYIRGSWLFWPFVALFGLLGLTGLIEALGASDWGLRTWWLLLGVSMTIATVGLIRWTRKRGVWTDAEGVRNIGSGKPSFTPWADVEC